MIRKGGYTLLELLISVSIFSGLVILILGTFVRSTSSSAQVSVLREKSEVARSLMSQVKNDFHYVYMTDFKDTSNGPTYRGYHVGADQLIMLLRFPNGTDNQLVRKEYTASAIPGSQSKSADFMLKESRNCSLDQNKLLNCPLNNGIDSVSILPEGFVLNYDQLNEPVFGGLNVDTTIPTAPTGYLKVQLTIKPSDHLAEYCAEVEKGTCYKVETILAAGNIS